MGFRTRLTRASLVVALGLCATVAQGALSANILGNPGFEDQSLAGFKSQPSVDHLDTIIPCHKFDRDNDLGRWMGVWGPPSQNYYGGFTFYDDPRDPALRGTAPEDYNNQANSDMANLNNSIDPYDPGNRILENVMFRPSFTQWVAAPVNHIPGQFSFSMDFFLELFTEEAGFFEAYVYGSHQMPYQSADYFLDPEVAHPGRPGSVLDADPLMEFNWWYHWERDGQIASSLNGHWSTISTDDTAVVWDFDGSVKNFGGSEVYQDYLAAEITEVYEYYTVTVYSANYGEPNPYKWLYGGRVVDNFSIAFDDLALTVEVSVPGDFNNDGVANLLDINDFVTAIVDMPTYMATYPYAHIPTIDPSQGAQGNDPIINLIDIPYFVDIVTGGGAVEVPEPAAGLLLLTAVTVTALRRRDH